ncbi:MAG: hypothetical protein OXE87_17510 [Chloroflexi bacterium]|nr:hypothetical protein [Chloroflexota bacterium]
MNRTEDTRAFYQLLHELEQRFGGTRTLTDCHGRMPWPSRGVYFFFEPGETRSRTGHGPRVVRVGTHALMAKSRTSLWNRLNQHRGTLNPLGGNHRGSIFRLLIGDAMTSAGYVEYTGSWGRGSSAPKAIRESERPAEVEVSRYIGAMPFLVVSINDAPGPESQRGYIERNAIALLSGYSSTAADPPSANWLGFHSSRERVRRSGLWNNNHVDECYEPAFLGALEKLIHDIG